MSSGEVSGESDESQFCYEESTDAEDVEAVWNQSVDSGRAGVIGITCNGQSDAVAIPTIA